MGMDRMERIIIMRRNNYVLNIIWLIFVILCSNNGFIQL